MIYLSDIDKRDRLKDWMAGIIGAAFWAILISAALLVCYLVFGEDRSVLWLALLVNVAWLFWYWRESRKRPTSQEEAQAFREAAARALNAQQGP